MRELKITTQITNRDSKSVEKYLTEVAKISLINPEEETQLAKKIRSGDQKALEILTKANLRFVVSVAKQYQHQGLSLSDLINEGNLGLIKAAKRFDESKGFKFISYAVWWIRQSILQALAENGRLVRLPQNKIVTYNKIIKAFDAFEQENEHEPTSENLAEILLLETQYIEDVFKCNNRHASLDAQINESEDITLADTLQCDILPDDEIIKKSGLQQDVRRVLKKLNFQESEIIIAYFGLQGEETPTLDYVCKKYNLTNERVRQIKERALKKMRKGKIKDLLEKYLG